MRHLLACATALALSAPAVACINYSESNNHEREFRSQYRDSEYVPPQQPTTNRRAAATASERPGGGRMRGQAWARMRYSSVAPARAINAPTPPKTYRLDEPTASDCGGE